jgi:hypothetical protein
VPLLSVRSFEPSEDFPKLYRGLLPFKEAFATGSVEDVGRKDRLMPFVELASLTILCKVLHQPIVCLIFILLATVTFLHLRNPVAVDLVVLCALS